jgi:hypothetical protein
MAGPCSYLPKNKTEPPLGNPVVFSSLKRPVAYLPALMAGLTFCWGQDKHIVNKISKIIVN